MNTPAEALKTGPQARERSWATTPYKFGMVGATDSHTGPVHGRRGQLTSVSHSSVRALPQDRAYEHPFIKFGELGGDWLGMTLVASGYTGVWASEENTREAIFDAMERKETYATTGPAHAGAISSGAGTSPGTQDLRSRVSRPLLGYRKGRAHGWRPRRAKRALRQGPLLHGLSRCKDPIGANLDRIQIIKGWARRRTGELHDERVYDVAVSDDREYRLR